LADLDFKHLQQREEHWAIVDLVGKGGHIRTVPVPEWSRRSWMSGSMRLGFIQEEYSVASAEQANAGVMV
jgi:hypothetical protein